MRAYFKCIFVAIVGLDILFSYLGYNGYRIISKPLILISLLFYFISFGRNLSKTTYILTISALLFSLFGDIFLLFDKQNKLFFTLGLGAFLIAHVVYTFIFFEKRSKTVPKHFWWVVTLLFSYGILLFYILKENLGALKIPVICYILAITVMAIASYCRKENVSKASYTLVILGALFFIISDSVLAINMFVTTVPLSNILIMGTYALAQYLIVEGILRQNEIRY